MRYIYHGIRYLVSFTITILVILSIVMASDKHSTPSIIIIFSIIAFIYFLYILAIALLPIPFYTMMLENRPASANLFYNRAMVYLRRGNHELALQDLQSALQLKPKLARAYLARGKTYLARGKAYLAAKQYEPALQDFNHAEQIITKNARVYLSRGTLYSITRHYQEALQDFDRVLKSTSRFLRVSAYVGKAEVHVHLKDYQQALQELEHAITLAPRKVAFYLLHRGYIHLSFDYVHEALQDFEHLIKTRSHSAKVRLPYNTTTTFRVTGYINCAATYIELKEYQTAFEHIEQAIALDPQCAHSYYVRGLIYLWLNDIEQARTNIERSWQMNPLGSPYGLVLAWLDLCQRRPDQEIRERLETIGELDEMDYFARVSRGIAQWIHGNYAEALTTLQQHIETELKPTFAHFWIGVVYASLGHNDEAMAMIQHSLRRLPPPLLAPLHWLEEENTLFYQLYALPLLHNETGTKAIEP